MRTPVIFALFIFTLVPNIPALAQRDSVRVRVFDGTGNELQRPPKVRPAYNDKNYIGWNLYALGRGAFVLGYERILHPKHAINVDLGLTYRDFIYEGINTETLETGSAKTGHYVAAFYKFYPKEYSDFDEGLYLSPGVINRSYSVSYNVDYYNGSSTKTAKVDGGYSMTEYLFKMGYVRESYLFDNLIGDMYIGVGSRSITRNTYDVVTDNFGAEKITTAKETKRVPALYLGFKIGFTF